MLKQAIWKDSEGKKGRKLFDVVGGVAEQLSRAGEVDEKVVAISQKQEGYKVDLCQIES